MSNNFKPSIIFKDKLQMFYDIVMKKCYQYEKFEERTAFLEKIIDDCSRIVELAELFDEADPGADLISEASFDVDENFLWLLDDEKAGPDVNSHSMVNEEKPAYFILELFNRSGEITYQKTDGINDMRITFRLEKEKMNIRENEFTGKEDNDAEKKGIQILSGMSDVVRIFEAMKEAGIISSNTTVKQIAELFNDGEDNIAVWERNYNAAKSKIRNSKSHARSTGIRNFIKLMINSGFKANDIDLDDLIKYLEEKQNNAI